MRKAFDNISHVVLRGKRYRIILATRLGSESQPLRGDCSDPKDSYKVIRYYVGLRGEERLETLIHEMLHACFWDVKEEGIEESALDVAKVLWRIGYRNGSDLAMLPDRDLPATIKIRTRRYSFEKIAGLKSGQVGLISSPNDKDKFVKIRVSLKGEKELEGMLRMFLLACYPDFDETVIAETSGSISKALWRIGYRRTVQ